MTVRLRVPRRFLLRGQEWTVVRRKGLTFQGRPASGVAKCGGENQIHLLAGRPQAETLRTFCHEVVHAAMPIGLIPRAQEEKVADALSGAVEDIVRALVKEG